DMTGRKQLVVGLVVLAIATAIAFSATTYLRRELFPVALGTKAPDFTAVSVDSAPREVHLSDYRGQVVMINVWATWCLPCRVEMPSIEALHQAYAPKGFKVLAVSVDDPGHIETIRGFASQYNLTFEILHDPAKRIVDQYDILGYPETFIIGRDGIIRKKLLSATDWNSADHRALVERLLAEPAG
ncbi:MAG: TlpA family protein disulfide reductase, partial [Gemmatimonadota bacterium]|nr:TlpA family protein disulfide reductase [Gemmatimonadota bacterium]